MFLLPPHIDKTDIQYDLLNVIKITSRTVCNTWKPSDREENFKSTMCCKHSTGQGMSDILISCQMHITSL